MNTYKRKNNRKRWGLKRKTCDLCTNLVNYVSFRNTHQIKKFINYQGQIIPSKFTGICSRHQRMVSLMVKRARFMAFIPYYLPRIKLQRQIIIQENE